MNLAKNISWIIIHKVRIFLFSWKQRIDLMICSSKLYFSWYTIHTANKPRYWFFGWEKRYMSIWDIVSLKDYLKHFYFSISHNDMRYIISLAYVYGRLRNIFSTSHSLSCWIREVNTTSQGCSNVERWMNLQRQMPNENPCNMKRDFNVK